MSVIAKADPQTKAEKLNGAYWFNEHLAAADSPRFSLFCTTLLDAIYARKRAQRKQVEKHLPQLKILILNLILAIDYHDGIIAISKRPDTYSAKKRISYRVLVEQLLGGLVGMKFLEEHLGYGGSLVGVKRSRFEVLPIFETQLRNCGVEDNAISHAQPERLIVLKDKDKRLVRASEEDVAIREVLERQVRQINTRISKSFVDLILTIEEMKELRRAMRERKEEGFSSYRNTRRLDLSNKYLYRVFNRSSFGLGGRFYGGWWGSLPKEWRPFITIDNRFTEEIDFSAMHINLLYNEIGIDPKNLFQDPYALEGLDLAYRNTTKQIMLILLNATTLKKSLKAVNAKAKEEGSELSLPKEMKSYSDYIAHIERCHEPIKQFIGKDVGVSLQNKDSKIAMNIMLRMNDEHQATCLPIHDSFIVADPHADALKEVMLQEYKAFTGFECRVATKSETRGKVDNEQRRQIIDAMYEDEEEQRLGYPARLAAWAKENDGIHEIQSGNPITET